MGGRVREALLDGAVLLASTVATILFVEFVLFPPLLRYLPLKLQPMLTERGIRTLAQSSKRGTIPHDYVALVGDSYAAGDGDWFRTVDQDGNPPFHSAHLLHGWTRRDVLSFGRSGAGNLRGLVEEPIAEMALLARTARFRIEPPRDVLVYFYEGNDLDDNLEDLRRRYDPDFDRAHLRDPATFRRFLDEVVIGRDPEYRKALAFRFRHNFFVLRALRHELDLLRARGGEASKDGGDADGVGGEGPRRRIRLPTNRFALASGVTEVRRRLQSPALALTEEEIATGVYVFRQSLARLREAFPEAGLHVLYVPSPLSCYAPAGRSVHIDADHYRDRASEYPAERVAERSDQVCGEIERAVHELGAGFHDARPALRRSAREALIHGPEDWKHLNRRGYEALARAALEALGVPPGGGRCARLSASPSEGAEEPGARASQGQAGGPRRMPEPGLHLSP